MQWLNTVVDEVTKKFPDGEILVESGVSPSGVYHVGTLREVLTCDAILLELRRRGRKAKHLHYVDDLDVLRKVPVNVPPEYEKYLGKPLCDIPAPDGSDNSYSGYFLNDFLKGAKKLHMDMEVILSHEKYRRGEMGEAIEKVLIDIDKIRQVIEEVSGRKLEKDWAPIQVLEGGYLKNRRFVSIDPRNQNVTYLNSEDKKEEVDYSQGSVKLNWRVDWPARWWQLGVKIEPFGRDHATKGGSYDTGAAIAKEVFGIEPPLPVPFNFINSVGETKKMSKSTGNIIAISEITKVLPPEVVRFFTLRYAPEKQLFFDQAGISKLIDDYAALLAKPDKTPDDEQLIDICQAGAELTVSSLAFSHLVASYQAALRDPAKTLEIIARTETEPLSAEQKEIIGKQLEFIERWLNKWAPDDLKFKLVDKLDADEFSDEEKTLLAELAEKISSAPEDADGEWFHKAIYELKEAKKLTSAQVFTPLYRALIGKDSGPRAGWFLSILPRDWLIKRLHLEA